MSSHQSRDWWYFYTQVAPVQQNLILVNKHTWQYAVGAIFMPKISNQKLTLNCVGFFLY